MTSKLKLACVASVIILVLAVPAFCEPSMSVPMWGDEWGPFLLYKNVAQARYGNSTFFQDWEIGLRTTASGYAPITLKRNCVWSNDDDHPFSLTFTKSSGKVVFCVSRLGAFFNTTKTVTYYYDEYAGRGFDELHVMAASYFDLFETYRASLTDLKINGNNYDFIDLVAEGTHNYATISGLNYESFTLTGNIVFAWTSGPYGDSMEGLFAFGEPYAGDPPDAPGKFTWKLIGDLNNDLVVNMTDYAILTSHWQENCSEPNCCADPDWCGGGNLDANDCVINYLDLQIFADNWLSRKYGGGSGTVEDPYLIFTPAQMNAIGVYSDDWDKNFKLMADINLDLYTGSAFNTIGDLFYPFTGVFDGNRHCISTFSQGGEDDESIGLFRRVAAPGEIKNLWIADPTIVTEDCSYVGVIVGRLEGGTLSNCHVRGGLVRESTDPADPIGTSVGGLVGRNEATISESSAICTVYGYDYVGGLVGLNTGSIEECFSDGNDVSIHDYVGSLVGYNYDGVISDSYSRKPIFAHDHVGGLVGWNNGATIERCYATGAISENSDDKGGLVGWNGPLPDTTVSVSFWDIETGGPDNGVGTPKSTIEMRTESTFTSAGWDFATPVWAIDENNDYPRLWWEVLVHPDPMGWELLPQSTGEYSIFMRAASAWAMVDVGVEYYFHNVTDPAHDSGWQDDPNYADTELHPGTEYIYQVKARNKAPWLNETAYSAQQAAFTATDTTTPTPDPMEWASPPAPTGPGSIIMTAAAAWDINGVEYYFINIEEPNHSCGWQESTTFEDTGLEPDTEYTYQVLARDKSPNNNMTLFSVEAVATTDDPFAPEPDPMSWESLPEATGPYTITMTAALATDNNGVEYYFNNVTDPNHDSGWQDSQVYTDTALVPEAQYTYKVKARDKSTCQNETAYSGPDSTTTPSDVLSPEPDPMTWSLLPEATSAFSIRMIATTATDQGEVEYYFNNVTDPNHDSGWQDSPVFEDAELSPETQYDYQVKARDKSPSLNETTYSSLESAVTLMDIPPVEEQEVFASIASHDGRVWNSGPGTLGVGRDSVNDTYAALRIGDFGSANQEYRTVLSFDTSFLPDNATVISATLEMNRGYKAGIDPFTWGGSCIIDIVNPYFSTSDTLQNNDWEAEPDANAVATFSGDPGGSQWMVSSDFNAEGCASVNLEGTTQLKVYFTNGTNGNGATDCLGFYSSDYEDPDKWPRLTVRSITTTPCVRFTSTEEEDGRVWDRNGVGIGFNGIDHGDVALRLGDYSTLQGPVGYRNFVSFDTSSLPDECTVILARLELWRGADVGINPFDGWGGDCVVDIKAPFFGVNRYPANSDWQDVADAESIAYILADPGEDRQMLSTEFDATGMSLINTMSRTQLRVYFVTSHNGDEASDFVGFYSGEIENPSSKRPKLVVRYSLQQ